MLALVLAIHRRLTRRVEASPPTPERDRAHAGNAAAARQQELLREYARGFSAGAEETLDQLAGCSRYSLELAYDGPRPQELEQWIGRLRRTLAMENSR